MSLEKKNMYRVSYKVVALKKLEFKRCENVKFPVNLGLNQGEKTIRLEIFLNPI